VPTYLSLGISSCANSSGEGSNSTRDGPFRIRSTANPMGPFFIDGATQQRALDLVSRDGRSVESSCISGLRRTPPPRGVSRPRLILVTLEGLCPPNLQWLTWRSERIRTNVDQGWRPVLRRPVAGGQGRIGARAFLAE